MNEESKISKAISAKESRMIRARQNSGQEIWFGLGTMGLIGWSVAVPTLLGAAAGIWLDSHYPVMHSWTMALLVAGLAIGCFSAWQWIDQQAKEMNRREEDDGTEK